MKSFTKYYANTSFGQIHYLTAGNSDKPVLLLLHQAPSTSEMYKALMTHLADSFYCIAPDFIGFGLSDPLDEHSVNKYAKSIVELIHNQGLHVDVLFGHHTGAAVAAEIAAEYPELVSKLVLSGPPLLTEQLKQNLPNVALDLTLDEDGQFLDTYWQKLRSKDLSVPLSLTLREMQSALMLGGGYKKAYQAVADFNFANSINKIMAPTLVFAGTRDVLHPMVDKTIELLANGFKAEIGDTSTYVCETHPGLVAQLIYNFMFEKL